MSEVEKKEETTTTPVVEKTEEKKEETTTTPAATTTEESDKKEETTEYAKDEEPAYEGAAILNHIEKKETKTNEEDEDVIFEMRAKLFRFDTTEQAQWKERGTGNVRYLKDKVSGRVRIVMRREKTFKVCLNHYMSPLLSLGPMVGSDKSWVWKCPLDYSEEEHPEGIPELFAIRFANPENANTFKAEFEKCQAANKEIEESKK